MPKRFPTCFVSVSFSEKDKELRQWFLDILGSFDFQPVGGDLPEPRPPPEKIRDAIRNADAFVAIITRREKFEGEERWKAPNWVLSEIGMAYEAEKPVVLFVENGVDHKGLGDRIADYVEFDRTELHKATPLIVRFLASLKEGLRLIPDVSGAKRQVCLALANELSNFLVLMREIESRPQMPWTLSFYYAKITGRIFDLGMETISKVEKAYGDIAEMNELTSRVSSIEWQIAHPFLSGKRKPKSDLLREKEETVSNIAAKKEEVIQSISDAGFSLIVEALPEIGEMLGQALQEVSGVKVG